MAAKKLTDLKQDTSNYNKHSQFGMGLLEKSIRQFGFVEAGLISEDDVICSGNARQETAVSIGMEDVQIIDIDGTKPIYLRKKGLKSGSQEFKTLGLALNAVGKANVVFDAELIEAELGEAVCVEWGVEVAKQEPEAEEDDFNGVAPKEPITVLGDLYELNEHRLHCADSCDSDAVAKLMNGKIANLVFTDPPYGVSFQSNMRTKTEKFEVLKNDTEFITEWIPNLELFSKGFVFVWTSWKVLKEWIDFCSVIGELSNIIIWDKGGGGIGDLKKTFASDYEVALVYNRGNEITGKRLGSVWNVGKDAASKYCHPTQKPIGLMALAIENVTKHNCIVADLFLGSGTTLIASDQLNRICYGQELDPKYCDVIVARFIKHKRETGSSLVIKRNGQQLSEDDINKYIENTNA